MDTKEISDPFTVGAFERQEPNRKSLRAVKHSTPLLSMAVLLLTCVD